MYPFTSSTREQLVFTENKQKVMSCWFGLLTVELKIFLLACQNSWCCNSLPDPSDLYIKKKKNACFVFYLSNLNRPVHWTNEGNPLLSCSWTICLAPLCFTAHLKWEVCWYLQWEPDFHNVLMQDVHSKWEILPARWTAISQPTSLLRNWDRIACTHLPLAGSRLSLVYSGLKLGRNL